MKKIAFLAPQKWWWPAEIYKNIITEYKKSWEEKYEFVYFQGVFSWIYLHFFGKKFDTIVSTIPFFWKPFSRKFFINIHGNFKKEKNLKTPGGILAHFYEKNLAFSDANIFPSNWLANEFFDKKNIIIPNIIQIQKNQTNPEKNLQKTFFTITSFHFYEKCRGVLEIVKNLESLNEWYTFHIFGGGKYLEKIKNQIPKTENTIIFHNFTPKDEIFAKIPKNSIFVYHSFLDIIPTVILEAIYADFNILVYKLAQFEEFFDEEIFYKNQKEFAEKLQKIQPQTKNLAKITEIFDNKKNLAKWLRLFE